MSEHIESGDFDRRPLAERESILRWMRANGIDPDITAAITVHPDHVVARQWADRRTGRSKAVVFPATGFPA